DRANVFIAESDDLLRSPESVILIHHQECRIRVVWYPGFRVERVALESSNTLEFGIIRSHPTRDIEAESHRLYQSRFRRNRIDMPAPRIFLRVAVTPQSLSEIYQIVLQIPTAVFRHHRIHRIHLFHIRVIQPRSEYAEAAQFAPVFMRNNIV